MLLKVEDAEDKVYWLYLDMPLTSTLKTLDTFLREIWLECCGHMSAFYQRGGVEIGKSTKLESIPTGSVLFYEYDFGSTTELRITFLHPVSRPKQRKAVRLLARNLPLPFECGQCGEAADYICCECDAMEEYPFFCEKCLASHEHEGCALPVVNSPRMGVCAYCGEYDGYEYSDSAEKEG
ncbi:MAG TPA: hypothetical protein IAB89_06545 [Candidatus Caccousia avicola]|uniref:Uncharacterized protein n=1 Tax=Candidatus Caccousia avicola TaxID=2840721 RepID=A0A9D1AMU9_9FIRM|nr:hypothetical protein [Candidatus Caccousia avicola]